MKSAGGSKETPGNIGARNAQARAAAGKLRESGPHSEKNKGYRNKGGRKFSANLRKSGKHNGFTPPFITSKIGEFRANPANFAQIRSILFLSTFFGLHRLLHPRLFDSNVKRQEIMTHEWKTTYRNVEAALRLATHS